MNIKTLVICSAACAALAGASGEAMAQGRAKAPPAAPTARGAGDLDRQRDRLDTPDQDRLRDRDRDLIGDRDRLRDRLSVDQAETQLGAFSLLTDAERLQFHQQMQAATTDNQRAEIRSQHRHMIEARVRDLGIDAPFGNKGASATGRQRMMMAQVLTDQERTRFRDQMRDATTEQERQRIREAHEETIRERTRELGLSLPRGFGEGQ